MWQDFQRKIVQVNKATGLEITFVNDEQFLINGVTVGSKKHNVLIEQQYNGITDLRELAKKSDLQIPLTIVFNGKGVLAKKTVSGPTTEHPLSAVLPNANPEDFYYETHTYDSFMLVVVTRKVLIEKFIAMLKEVGFKIMQVTLGFNDIISVLPFLDNGGQNLIVTNSFVLHTNSQKNIVNYDLSESLNESRFDIHEYVIGNQYLRPSHLLAFAAAINLLADPLSNSTPIASPTLINERFEFRYFKLFRFAAIFFLSAVFFILLLNFIIYNHYFSRNKELQVTQALSSQKRTETTLLTKSIRGKQDFLNESGWNKPCRASFYADRIASLIPYNTLLTSLAIYPLKSNPSVGFPVMNFKTDTILVAGTCDNPADINQFINNLKIISDFKTIALKNYLYKKEKEMATFSIEIIIR
jgi:hypothetical protein